MTEEGNLGVWLFMRLLNTHLNSRVPVIKMDESVILYLLDALDGSKTFKFILKRLFCDVLSQVPYVQNFHLKSIKFAFKSSQER